MLREWRDSEESFERVRQEFDPERSRGPLPRDLVSREVVLRGSE